MFIHIRRSACVNHPSQILLLKRFIVILPHFYRLWHRFHRFRERRTQRRGKVTLM